MDYIKFHKKIADDIVNQLMADKYDILQINEIVKQMNILLRKYPETSAVVCTFNGCEEPVLARSLCQYHYNKMVMNYRTPKK